MKTDKNGTEIELELKLDPQTRWCLLPQQLPGVIEGPDPRYAPGAIVRPLVPLVYPHGTEVDTLKSREGGELDPGTLVGFSLRPLDRSENPYHSEAVDLERISRDRLDEFLADYRTRILDELAKRVPEELPALRQRVAELELQFEAELGRRLESRMKDVRQEESRLREQAERLEAQRQAISAERAEVDAERAELQEQLKRWEDNGAAALRYYELTTAPSSRLRPAPAIQRLESDGHPPDNWSEQLRDLLADSGLTVSPGILRQFLSAIFCAAAYGYVVILAGPPGVGKTSIVEQVAPAIGAGSGIVPVRPAWTDSTDLFGFFNPVHRVYQPTPFVEQLLLAGRYQEAHRLYMICLDELNLARIENYAADLLAKLEKSRTGDAKIDLYARSIADCLSSERAELARIADQLTPEQAARVVQLETAIERYPPTLDLPSNLVILGTVNVDETTHILSPKVLDRAFVVQLPPADWSQVTNGPREMVDEGLTPLSAPWVRQIAELDLPSEIGQRSAQLWGHLCHWQDHYLKPLGVDASYRLASSFQRFMRISHYGLSMAPNRAASAFVQMRVLPRVSFTRDQAAVREDQPTRIEVYNEWREDRHLKEFPGLGEILTRMDERSPGPVLQYWQ